MKKIIGVLIENETEKEMTGCYLKINDTSFDTSSTFRFERDTQNIILSENILFNDAVMIRNEFVNAGFIDAKLVFEEESEDII